MTQELAHRIPDSNASRLVGLGLAATSLALWGSRHMGERVLKTPTLTESESLNSATGDGGFTPGHDGAEIVLLSNPDIQIKLPLDPQALRVEGII